MTRVRGCSSCGQPGHYATTCAKGDLRRDRTKKAPDTRRCLTCLLDGHFAAECPTRVTAVLAEVRVGMREAIDAFPLMSSKDALHVT